MSQRILVLGATSKIAQETLRYAAADHKELLLVGRSEERLVAVAGDLLARGATSADYLVADLANISSHKVLVEQIHSVLPNFDTILLAYGSLGEQTLAEHSAEYALQQLTINFTSAASLLTSLSRDLAESKAGCIAVITSVAGDRARRSNYVYGTAKGALALFTQGLRAKLTSVGVRILTIKPGPVATPMTAQLSGNQKFADPRAVGYAIYKEIEHGKRDILYVPSRWRWIMMVIRHIPEWVGKRLTF